MKVVTFTVAGRDYAVELGHVREVIRLPEVVRIPDAPDWVEGIMDLRGEVILVVSLRKRLRLGEKDSPAINRLLVAHGRHRSLGLVVDTITGVVPVQAEKISRMDDLLNPATVLHAVARIGDRLYPLLDLPAVLGEAEAGSRALAGEGAAAVSRDLCRSGDLSMGGSDPQPEAIP